MSVFLKASATTLLVALASCAGNPPSQVAPGRDGWLLPAPVAGTVEDQINDLFREHADACRIPLPSGRSYVPRAIRAGLGSNVTKRGEVAELAGGSLMWYVFETSEIDQPVTANPMAARLLQPDYRAADLLLEGDLRYDGMASIRSCAGYLAATVQGGGSFPSAAASASVNADYERKSSLTIVSGRFTSPLHAMINRPDWEGRYTQLQLWEMYRTFPNLVGNAQYMREFNGVMLLRAENLSMNADVNLQGEANLGAVAARMRAGVSTSQQLDVRRRRTVIFSDVDNARERRARFTALPTPGEIAQGLSSATTTVLNPDAQVRAGVPFTHRFAIEGMPGAVCGRGWEAYDLAPGFFATSPSVQRAATQRAGVPSCEFTITGMPHSDLFLPRSNPRLRMTVRSADIVGGERLAVVIDQGVTPTSHPVVSTPPGPIQPQVTMTSGGTFAVVWRVNLGLQHSQNPVVDAPGTSVIVDDSQPVTCGDRSIPVNASGSVLPGSEFVVEITAINQYANTDFDITSGQTCQFPTSLTLGLRAGGQITRALHLRLQFPGDRSRGLISSVGSGGIDN